MSIIFTQFNFLMLISYLYIYFKLQKIPDLELLHTVMAPQISKVIVIDYITHHDVLSNANWNGIVDVNT